MRKRFPGYYRPTDEEFKENFKNGVFVFDTNVLLNLYRYSKESRKDLVKVLVAVKSRIWLPNHAAFEYQRRRIEVLLAESGLFGKLAKVVEKAITDIDAL